MLLGPKKYSPITNVNAFISLKMYLEYDFWNMFWVEKHFL